MNETIEFNHKKIIKENLKIVVENKSIGDANENDLLDYDEMETDDNVNSNVEVVNTLISNNRNVEIGGDDDNQLEQNEEDETEFHVNLDKVPPTLQNTILNEKIYLNESLKDDPPAIELDNVTEEHLKSLYESLNLTEKSFLNSPIEPSYQPGVISLLSENDLYRREAIHLYGVDELSTSDIFDYLKEYKPVAVEWINDHSCNVVWKNENHAANALLGMSLVYEDEVKVDTENKEEEEDTGNRKPPQGTKWRIGAKSIKGYQIYMRYARKIDRKQKGAESRSKFYVKYGNPNYGNIKGLISNSKRQRMKAQQINDAVSDLFEPEQDEEQNGRKLVSYNLDDESGAIEEFGTGASDRDFGGVAKKKNASPSRDMLKRKKMHLYADELNEKRSEDEEDDNYGRHNSHKRRNHYEPYGGGSSRHGNGSSVKSRLSGLEADRVGSSRYDREDRYNRYDKKIPADDLRHRLKGRLGNARRD